MPDVVESDSTATPSGWKLVGYLYRCPSCGEVVRVPEEGSDPVAHPCGNGPWGSLNPDALAEHREAVIRANAVLENEDRRIFQAMCDLEWHSAGHPTIWTRGSHLNWTEVVVGEHAFNIDDAQDRQRLINWGDAMRNRTANAPLPEPAARVEAEAKPDA